MPMDVIPNTRSYTLTLEETLACLSAAEAVDGLAVFGSQVAAPSNPISDYDVLVLIANAPVDIFQMFTYISGRMADVVFVETETADRALTLDTPVTATCWEHLFMLKMLKAKIVFDRSGRLKRVQQHVADLAQSPNWLQGSMESEVYAAWFWQNHTLAHIRRMYQSNDPVYLTSADIMLMGGLSNVCRAYFQIRRLAWEGEKAALRYLQTHDPHYLVVLRACIAASEREGKLEPVRTTGCSGYRSCGIGMGGRDYSRLS